MADNPMILVSYHQSPNIEAFRAQDGSKVAKDVLPKTFKLDEPRGLYLDAASGSLVVVNGGKKASTVYVCRAGRLIEHLRHADQADRFLHGELRQPPLRSRLRRQGQRLRVEPGFERRRLVPGQPQHARRHRERRRQVLARPEAVGGVPRRDLRRLRRERPPRGRRFAAGREGKQRRPRRDPGSGHDELDLRRGHRGGLLQGPEFGPRPGDRRRLSAGRGRARRGRPHLPPDERHLPRREFGGKCARGCARVADAPARHGRRRLRLVRRPDLHRSAPDHGRADPDVQPALPGGQGLALGDGRRTAPGTSISPIGPSRRSRATPRASGPRTGRSA